ncbi:MAG TPA: sulfonate ABC transporter permease [Clostridiales bacterium]|nr:sulfonate ABC transporter permease [Clostridiales bacterium]
MKTNEKYSKEHLLYVNNRRKNKFFIIAMRFLVLAAFISLWEILSAVGAIDSFLMSSPSRIIKTVKNLVVTGNLWMHVGTTLYETVVGFLIATALGTAIAVAFWWSENLRKIFEPYVIVLNSLPKIALGPIIIVWFGSGTKSIVFMTVIITLIVTIITMQNAFLSCGKGKIMLMKSMGANKFQILSKLILPHSFPSFISCLKINVGMAWIGSIMGEYLTSKQGIGYLIVYGGQVFKLDLVMASTVILCVLAGGMYALVALLEKKTTRKRER